LERSSGGEKLVKKKRGRHQNDWVSKPKGGSRQRKISKGASTRVPPEFKGKGGGAERTRG